MMKIEIHIDGPDEFIRIGDERFKIEDVRTLRNAMDRCLQFFDGAAAAPISRHDGNLLVSSPPREGLCAAQPPREDVLASRDAVEVEAPSEGSAIEPVTTADNFVWVEPAVETNTLAEDFSGETSPGDQDVPTNTPVPDNSDPDIRPLPAALPFVAQKYRDQFPADVRDDMCGNPYDLDFIQVTDGLAVLQMKVLDLLRREAEPNDEHPPVVRKSVNVIAKTLGCASAPYVKGPLAALQERGLIVVEGGRGGVVWVL